MISPSVYVAVDRARIPLVQTLHNFRLLCLQAMFLREGRVCEDCLGRLPVARSGCTVVIAGQASQSSVLAGMLGLASRDRNLPDEGQSLHRAERVQPREIRRRRPAGRADRGEVEFCRGSGSGRRPPRRADCLWDGCLQRRAPACSPLRPLDPDPSRWTSSAQARSSQRSRRNPTLACWAGRAERRSTPECARRPTWSCPASVTRTFR